MTPGRAAARRSGSPRTFGRDPSLLDPIAPDWVVRILAPKKADVPWGDMVRSGLTVPVVLALSLLLGQPGLGVFAGMGALVGSFGDNGGSFRARFRRVLMGGGAGLLGLVVGRAAAEQGVAAVVTIGVLAAVSALLSSLSANLSFAGLQLLVYIAVAGALPRDVGLHLIAVAYAAGIAWALLLSYAQTRFQPPGNPALAGEVTALHGLADELRRPLDGAGAEPAGGSDHVRRVALVRQLSTAYDEVVTARSTSAGRRDDLRRLASTLTATFELVTAVFALPAASDDLASVRAGAADLVDRLAGLVGQRRRREVRAQLAALEDEVARIGSAETDGSGGDADVQRLRDALLHVLRTVEGHPSVATGGDRRSWAGYLPGQKAWVFAARLAITMAVAETVRQLVPLEKPYWIVLTAALVLKPDLGSVFARGVQRTLGTLVGVLLGVAVVAVVPHGAWLLLPMAVLAFAFPYGRNLNYGLLSTFITPLVLLLIDFGARVDGRIALDRLLDTAIGAGIVLVVGYLCWPGTWRPRLGEHIAAGVEALGGYARVAFGADRSPVGPARRRTYGAMSDIRSELQSTLAEPPPLSRQAAAWWPLIAQLEKAADDLTEAAARARHPAERPPAADVAQLVAAFDDLAAALRGHRAPRDLAGPSSPLLADVSGDLRGARGIARGPIGA
ncbi:FUSC family protein [Microlunatus antarcticus]|uniref:Putative membrane protein YccC n=1 Tax=Microlunatus antarcticus TaxID=53388 RepID=A0A7W5P635_9ACTN|nr:putative membrane protein YccC [Microlunatus antarcticus]